jgi:hypothetical protein
MLSSKAMLLLILATTVLILSQTHIVAAQAQNSSSAVIQVQRSTVLFPNYAIATDTIHVINGSVDSLEAAFPSGTLILNVTGQDLNYAYQLSTAPTHEVVVLSQPLGSGQTTQLKYVYTGFVNSGQGNIAIQAGYSLPSVNDTASYSYGVSGLGSDVQLTVGTKSMNLTKDSVITFNGTTQPYAFATGTATFKTPYQAFILNLDRSISYSNSQFHVSDHLTIVWASTSTQNQIYMLLPKNVLPNTISLSDFFGNLSSSFSSTSYPNYSSLIVRASYQMQQGSKYGFQISYSVPGAETNLSQLGFYGMYVQLANVNLYGVSPSSGSWQPIQQGFSTSYRNLLPNNAALDVELVGVGPSDTGDLGSFVVLVVGVVTLATSYTYTYTKNRKTVRVTFNQSILTMLQATSSALESTVENVQKYTQGSIRIGVASSSLNSLIESERRLVRELGEAVSKGQLDKSTADNLIASFREARTALSDTIDLQTQFNQKKIRQNVYSEIKSRYQKIYNNAVANFKEELSNLGLS